MLPSVRSGGPTRPGLSGAYSICINQRDNNEREYQAALIGVTYETYRCTLVCLGFGLRLAGSDHGQDVVIMVNKVNDLIDSVLNNPDISEGWNSFLQVEATDALVTDIKWITSRNAMILHPWFIVAG